MTWGVSASTVDDRGLTVAGLRPAPPEQQRRAVRTLAANATDAAELVEWLDMFGLTAQAGLERS